MISRGDCRRWLAPALTVVALAAAAATIAPARAAADTIQATVGANPTGRPMSQGFVGLSLEFRALHVYTGRDPGAVNPVFLNLVRQLAPGQAPVLRIGGDSTDDTWWPMPGVIAPGGVNYALTPGWLRETRAMAAALRARLILGVNLAAARPALAAAEARAFLQGIGASHLEAIEIGNEADVYSVFPWYRDGHGHVFFARGGNWGMGPFTNQFARWRAAMPVVPLAGPAFAELTWLGGLGRFLSAEPDLRLVTIHRYPLHGCLGDPTSPSFPSMANLLSDRAAAGMASDVAPYAAVAHAHGVRFRVAEMNSAAVASCIGRKGVSATFGSALWALDALFNLAAVGVDGVNLHTLPLSAYELFTFSRSGGRWHAFVHPEYYGLVMFEQAFPPHAQLLPVSAPAGQVKVWATQTPDGAIRVELVNKDTSAAHTVNVQLAHGATSAQLEYLTAPSASSTSGVTLGGQSFGTDTTTGTFREHPAAQPILPELGAYSVTLPAASAALLTQP